MKNVFLIEDHDEALKVWRRERVRQADLLHFDAHLDYALPSAEDPVSLLRQARSVRELKEKLETSQLFLRYERDYARQTNIGNFIYPAMRDGIVKNFWWIVPGSAREFQRSLDRLKKFFSTSFPGSTLQFHCAKGVLSVFLGTHVIRVCCLETLPFMRSRNLLLDIDVDYLVINTVQKADHTQCIGVRKPWIEPDFLLSQLAVKIPFWRLATISYSVNGGFTPLLYKYYADKITLNLEPNKKNVLLQRRLQASKSFCVYRASGIPTYYRAAVRLDATCRAWDNNYGPLYLKRNNFRKAEIEFRLIHKADPGHSGALYGLGKIALHENRLNDAQRYLQGAWKNARSGLFKAYRAEIIFAQAALAWKKKEYYKGVEYVQQCIVLERLNPQYYFWAGRFLEKLNMYEKAVKAFQDAIRLGYPQIPALVNLLKISCRLPENRVIIDFAQDKVAALESRLAKLARDKFLANAEIEKQSAMLGELRRKIHGKR